MPRASKVGLALGFAAGIAIGATATAQDRKVDEPGRTEGRFGFDETSFRRFLESLKSQRPPAPVPSGTVEELADQVSELRLYLAPDRKGTVGEVATTAPTRLGKMTLQLEEGAVTFADDGVAPDREKGDGVFTARLGTSAETLWKSMRPSLAATARVADKSGREFIRRGPRDLVPAGQFLDSLRRSAPAAADAVSGSARKAESLMNARTLADAARIAGIDPGKTPILVVPVKPTLDKRDFAKWRIFDIPVFDRVPVPAPPVSIDKDKSLMVVSTGVVEDPNRTFDVCTGVGAQQGPWTFGHLMTEMSFGTGMTAEDYTLHWLSTWILAQEANGFIVNEPGRANQLQQRIIDSWLRASGTTLDIKKFPARLLAIVNRPDLADKIGYGVAGSAGEGRFVFGLLEKDAVGNCNTLPFTVIFEYGIQGGSCSAVKSWHQRWKDLDAFTPGTSQYNDALAAITAEFTEHGTNPAQTPNGSSLNQLRTNEIALGSPWQLREFRLQSSGAVPAGVLDLVTVKQTPDDGLMTSSITGSFITQKESEIVNDRHRVPERFPTIFDRFLGAKSDVPSSSATFWNPPGVGTTGDAPEARRKFSLNTCNACHGGETATVFTHIGIRGARDPGQPAELSGFLTGIGVTLPVPGVWPRPYNDLAERQAAMSNILTNSCFALLGVRRIPFVH